MHQIQFRLTNWRSLPGANSAHPDPGRSDLWSDSTLLDASQLDTCVETRWAKNQSRRTRSVLAENLYNSLTILLNWTAVTTVAPHMNKEVYNDNKVYKWYERSMWRMVHGTNSPWNE